VLSKTDCRLPPGHGIADHEPLIQRQPVNDKHGDLGSGISLQQASQEPGDMVNHDGRRCREIDETGKPLNQPPRKFHIHLSTEALLGEHYRDRTPCGPHSPFRRVRDLGGQILFLGCGLRPNTSMHGVEEVVDAPYLFGETIGYRITLEDGSVTHVPYQHHGFAGWAQRYDRVARLLEEETELRIGRVLQATAHLLEAQALWSRAEAAMRRDPYCFVEREGHTRQPVATPGSRSPQR